MSAGRPAGPSPRPGDAGVEIRQEGLQRGPFGLDRGAEVFLQGEALTGQLPALFVTGPLVLIGLPDLRDPVLVAQHQRYLVQVEAEQRLQLHDPFHPGDVAFRIAPQAAGRGTGRDDVVFDRAIHL